MSSPARVCLAEERGEKGTGMRREVDLLSKEAQEGEDTWEKRKTRQLRQIKTEESNQTA